MKDIITDLSALREPVEQLKFITDSGISKDEGNEIIAALKEVFDANNAIYALAAPQIGIKKRIFGIRFDDSIKFFINPIITKKTGLTVAPETFASMPNKEILIGRPDEITVVYYTQEFKYEDNKILGGAARIFDQMAQVLDGICPDELGLVSDINDDGPLGELSEDDIKEVTELWKSYVTKKLKAINESIDAEDDDVKAMYRKLKFTEDVINGRAQVIVDEPAEAKIIRNRERKAQNQANLKNFMRGKK